MEAKFQEITLGEPVCVKLKDIYFSDVPWPECHGQVSEKFTQLKVIARKFYSDKDDIGVLKELIRYSDQDIINAFMDNVP